MQSEFFLIQLCVKCGSNLCHIFLGIAVLIIIDIVFWLFFLFLNFELNLNAMPLTHTFTLFDF